MGVVTPIGYNRMPKQGTQMGMPVKVCFNYDTSQWRPGIVVRDDSETPFLTIIQLAADELLGLPETYVLSTECQYS